MLAYHNILMLPYRFSPLCCRLVCLRLRIYWPNFKRDGQPLRSFFAGILNFSQGLFILILLSFHTYCTNVCQKEHQFSYVLSEIWCYIFLVEAVFLAFHAYLGRMQYCESLVILIKSTLCNQIMYFSFANIFFPSKFPHTQQRLSRFVQCGSQKDMQLLF